MSNLRPGDISNEDINRILLGVLVVMMKDFFKGSARQKENASLWLFDDDPPGDGISAKLVCETLNIDLEWLRELILRHPQTLIPRDAMHRPYKRSKAERDKYRMRSKKKRDRQTQVGQNIISPELCNDLNKKS